MEDDYYYSRTAEDSNVTGRMRAMFAPQGTLPVVALQLSNRFFDHEFITKCIDELDQITVRAFLGQPATCLEKLAYALLCDSAYIDLKADAERIQKLKDNGNT
jgi:hypothetical protein